MTNRVMYDCIGASAPELARTFPNAELVAWYGTGSPDVAWTSADRSLFPRSVMVEIDQGYTGSPVPAATVRDVESGAWTPQGAVTNTDWTAERPTVYCNRSTLPAVIAAGWRKDVWLAWPGFTGDVAPMFKEVNIVAIQDTWESFYESSRVFDPWWPHAVPVAPSPQHLSVTIIGRVADMAWNAVPGATSFIVSYQAANKLATVDLVSILNPSASGAIHASRVPVPGGQNGTLIVDAIIGSARTFIVAVQL